MPLIALGVIGAVGATVGGIASSKAAGKQAQASTDAAQLESQNAQAALAEQKREYDTNQTNLAPWLQQGQKAIGQLSDLIPNLNAQEAAYKPFQAPTADEAAATPGYQFQLQQGQKALENSAAARGSLLTGGTAKALDNYSQGLAASNYQQTYNNAFNAYQEGYNQFQQGLSNQYNRLAGLSGTGQQAAQTLGSLGQQSAANQGNILLSSAAQQGQDIQNAGAATASGYVGVGNSVNSGLSNVSNTILLRQLGAI